MRLPLLVAANLGRLVSTPKVRLAKGYWKISVDGLVDSSFSVHRDDQKCDSELIEGDCVAQIIFDKKGTEQKLTIFAELVNA